MKTLLTRSGIILGVAALVLTAGISISAQKGTTIQVFKTPTCGCCHLWVKHLEANGYTTKVTDMDDLSGIKKKYGVPAKANSCHTAVVDGYTLEGHVPAAQVKKMLKERPAIAGLAVPGMPVGSPGMEYGTTVQPYNVVAFDKAGQMTVYASYGRK